MSAHPDKAQPEVSVGFRLEECGASASIKSRWVTAWDRLLGHRADRRGQIDRRALRDEERQERILDRLSEKTTEKLLEQLEDDPELVRRAARALLHGGIRDMENIEAVFDAATESLVLDHTDYVQAEGQADVLDEPFMHRFTQYASGASTDELRERWGRILASEIRKPGTFSLKTLRIVDELSTPTAGLFQWLCDNRIGGVVPEALCYPTFYDVDALARAGLILDQGEGHLTDMGLPIDVDGVQIWIQDFGDGRRFGFLNEFFDLIHERKFSEVPLPLARKEFRLGVPSHILTEEGTAIASILPDRQAIAFEKFLGLLRRGFNPERYRTISVSSSGTITLGGAI